ncbi:MAG: hypothetical protein ACREBI_04370 [Nitrosotalea sp.]
MSDGNGDGVMELRSLSWVLVSCGSAKSLSCDVVFGSSVRRRLTAFASSLKTIFPCFRFNVVPSIFQRLLPALFCTWIAALSSFCFIPLSKTPDSRPWILDAIPAFSDCREPTVRIVMPELP